MNMYDNLNTVEKHFDENFLPEYPLQAQWSELIELKKVINGLKRNITLLDIGIGNARVAKHLSGISEIWGKIDCYVGIEISDKCIETARKVVSDNKLENKVAIRKKDATSIDEIEGKFDLIIATWFTGGNFFPYNFSFETNLAGKLKNRPDLEHNQKFQDIFKKSYQKLNDGGEIILGSVYKNNDHTRQKQESFYKKSGMTIITEASDSFVATKEGFWSQRFDEKRIYEYFDWVKRDKISFIPLDTYDYAVMVRVKK
jgi:SAM-dependent methyltransferase